MERLILSLLCNGLQNSLIINEQRSTCADLQRQRERVLWRAVEVNRRKPTVRRQPFAVLRTCRSPSPSGLIAAAPQRTRGSAPDHEDRRSNERAEDSSSSRSSYSFPHKRCGHLHLVRYS